ncbi:MAG: gamma carbonic anhydrase family protein [Elusimicrobiota bacterium]
MISEFDGKKPNIASSAFIDPSAVIIGDAEIEEDVSVWPCAVIRADVERIKVGRGSNVQDCAVLHPNRNKPVIIGEGVTVGHCAVVHGSIVGKNSLIAMNATVIDSEIGDYCLIGAGCVITPGSKIPSRSLVLGLPHKIVRQLSEEEIKDLEKSEKDYIELKSLYEAVK